MKTKTIYIKTVEDLLKYKDTDTKIYSVDSDSYYFKFVNGVPCRFYDKGGFDFNCGFYVNNDKTYYVEEKCKPGEGLPMVTTKDIGELCLFWDGTLGESAMLVSKLETVLDSSISFPYQSSTRSWYQHCTRITTRAIKELQETSKNA